MSIVEQRQVVRGTLIGLIAPVIWSSYALIACLLKTLPQFEVLTISYLLAFLSLKLFHFKTKTESKPLRETPLRAWIAVFAGVCLFQFFYLGAFRLAPPEHAELINYLWPIFVLLGGKILSNQKLSFKHYFSSGLCFLGLLALFLTQGVEGPKFAYWPGYLFALGCAFSWTFYSLSIKHDKSAMGDLTASVCFVGFIVSLIIHLMSESFVLPDLSGTLGLLFSGCGVIAFTYLSWEKGMQTGSVSVLATFSNAVPIISIILLVIFDLTQPSWNLGVATLLIALGGWISLSKSTTGKLNFSTA